MFALIWGAMFTEGHRVCIHVHPYAFVCIHVHPYASIRMHPMHLYACACILKPKFFNEAPRMRNNTTLDTWLVRLCGGGYVLVGRPTSMITIYIYTEHIRIQKRRLVKRTFCERLSWTDLQVRIGIGGKDLTLEQLGKP